MGNVENVGIAPEPKGSVEKVGVAPNRSESARRPGTWNTVDIPCRLDPVRKLEAGLEYLPGLRLKPSPVDRPVDSAPAPLVAELVHPRL